MEGIVEETLRVRAFAWGDAPLLSVTAKIDGKAVTLEQTTEGTLWEVRQAKWTSPDGVYGFNVTAEDTKQLKATDTVRIVVGRISYSPAHREHTDVSSALEAGEDRGLLGTKLRPNKNGRKW